MPEGRSLQLTVDVPADRQTVFDAMTDWDSQREWMLGTTVRGIGVFRVERAGSGSRFVWLEEVDLPLGRLGQWAGSS